MGSKASLFSIIFDKTCISDAQDVMGLSLAYLTRPAAEETINDPTNNRHYWRYRIHVTLEDLLADDSLLGDLQVTPITASVLHLPC